MQLTQKESSLLKDMKDIEKLCIDKYARHASQASDAQLRQLFDGICETERQHLATLDTIGEGNTPLAASSAGTPAAQQFNVTYSLAPSDEKKNDAYLCTDALAGEKHASALYDTCIFEFSDAAVRNALNHIQHEEQQHGKKIYDYMVCNGMY